MQKIFITLFIIFNECDFLINLMKAKFFYFYTLRNYLKFGLIYFSLFFVLVELVSRYFIGLGNPPLSRQHKSIEYEFVPNQDLKRFHKKIKINSMGMRSDELLQNSNKKRILVYGDSVIWGGTITDQKDLSTEILKKLLEKNNYNYEVGNVSAGSWGPGNWLSHIIERGIYGADIIILVISSHDWLDNPTYESIKNNIHLPTKKPNFATEELIKRYIFPKIKKTFNSKNQQKNKQLIIDSKKGLNDLKQFISIVREKDAEIIVVQFWDRDEFNNGKPKEGNLQIKKVLKDNKVKNIDSVDRFRKCSKNPKDLYFDEIHPFTKLGQKCLGYVLFEAFQKTKFFNK